MSQGFVARHAEAIVIAVVVCVAILFGATSQFAATTAAFLMVWVLMAQGWNIISGFGGPLALGQAAYFGIADFVTLLLLDRYGMTQYVGILVGVAAALLIAFIVGGITLQKPAFFFAITSLLVPLILQAVIIYFGIFQIPRRLPPEPSLAMFWFSDAFPYLVTGGLLVIIAGFFTSSMRLRRMGRFLVANRENTRAAESSGVPTYRSKLIAYLIAAAIAALAGVLYGQLTFIFDPLDALDAQVSVQPLLLTLIGGIGTVFGPVLGGLIVVPAQQFLRIYVSGVPGLDLMLYALLLLAVSLWMPTGVYPALRTLTRRVTGRPAAASQTPVAEDTARVEAATDHASHAATMNRIEPVWLETDNLSIRFGGVFANRDVSLKLAPASRVGLIGPNGAGKTTLVNALMGDLRPSAGRVLIGGTDVSTWPPHRRFRAGLGRTFQIAHPFPAMTALESVAIGPLARGDTVADAEERAIEALSLLKLGHLARRPMRELNSVDAKLVELARLAASDLRIVLLDELLAGLVPAERSFILKALDQVSTASGWTVLMIEHLISDVRSFCPRVIVLVSGSIIADGDTSAVLADERVIEAYLGRRWAEAVV